MENSYENNNNRIIAHRLYTIDAESPNATHNDIGIYIPRHVETAAEIYHFHPPLEPEDYIDLSLIALEETGTKLVIPSPSANAFYFERTYLRPRSSNDLVARLSHSLIIGALLPRAGSIAEARSPNAHRIRVAAGAAYQNTVLELALQNYFNDGLDFSSTMHLVERISSILPQQIRQIGSVNDRILRDIASTTEGASASIVALKNLIHEKSILQVGLPIIRCDQLEATDLIVTTADASHGIQIKKNSHANGRGETQIPLLIIRDPSNIVDRNYRPVTIRSSSSF